MVVRRDGLRVMLCAFFFAWAHARPARADERVDLRLDLPGEALHCLSRGSLAEGIDARVREAGLPAGAVVDVSGARAGPGRWRLAVAIAIDGEPMGRRELTVEESECETVVDTLAVMVVLALRGSAEHERSPAPPESPPPDTAPPATAPAPPPPPAPAPLRRPTRAPTHPSSSLTPRLRADAGALLGVGDRVAVVGGFGMELGIAGGWDVGVLALGRFPSAIEVRGGALVLSSVGARLYVCARIVDLASGEVAACGALEVGVLRSAGQGFDVWNGTSANPYATIGPGLRARVPIAGPLFADVEMIAAVPWVRPALVIETDTGVAADIYRAPIVTLTATAGIGVAFR